MGTEISQSDDNDILERGRRFWRQLKIKPGRTLVLIVVVGVLWLYEDSLRTAARTTVEQSAQSAQSWVPLTLHRIIEIRLGYTGAAFLLVVFAFVVVAWVQSRRKGAESTTVHKSLQAAQDTIEEQKVVIRQIGAERDTLQASNNRLSAWRDGRRGWESEQEAAFKRIAELEAQAKPGIWLYDGEKGIETLDPLFRRVERAQQIEAVFLSGRSLFGIPSETLRGKVRRIIVPEPRKEHLVLLAARYTASNDVELRAGIRYAIERTLHSDLQAGERYGEIRWYRSFPDYTMMFFDADKDDGYVILELLMGVPTGTRPFIRVNRREHPIEFGKFRQEFELLWQGGHRATLEQFEKIST